MVISHLTLMKRLIKIFTRRNFTDERNASENTKHLFQRLYNLLFPSIQCGFFVFKLWNYVRNEHRVLTERRELLFAFRFQRVVFERAAKTKTVVRNQTGDAKCISRQ